MDKIKEAISNLTGIDHVKITSRCNEAIKLALQTAKSLGKTKCYVLDQGGWITYKKYAKQLDFQIIEIVTEDCSFDPAILDAILDSKSVLLIHSLSGYFYEQPMKDIYEICQYKKALLINDCCGSVSKRGLLEGDIFVCSFGRWKPIDHGTGGFIGSRDSKLFEEIHGEDYDIEDPESLLDRIGGVHNRVSYINKMSLKLIDDIETPVLNESQDLNLVVIAPFEDEKQEELLVHLAQATEIHFEVCPRDIRVNRPAISFEVKRLNI